MKGLPLKLRYSKSDIAWLAALSTGLSPAAQWQTLTMFAVVCRLVGFAADAFHSLRFSIDGMMQIYVRFRQTFDGIVATLFIATGLGFIRSTLSR